MRDEYSCDIIKDLLPGYVDHLLSEAGTELVESHLEECGACRRVYEEMKEELSMEAEAGISAEPAGAAAVDGLKKVKKRTRHLKIAVGTLAGVLILLLSALLLKIYVIGEPLSTSQISVSELQYDEERETLTVSGEMERFSYRISRVKWAPDKENENIVNLTVFAADTLPFGQDQTDFSVTIPDVKGKRVYLSCPEYDRLEVYDWGNDHYEVLDELEETVYDSKAGLERERDILNYGGGVTTVDGEEGIQFYVEFLKGDQASYWWFLDQLVTDGELEPADFELWISLEKPHRMLVYDYQTGQYTEDYSIIAERKKLVR